MASKGEKIIKIAVGVIMLLLAAGDVKNRGKELGDVIKDFRKPQ